MKNWIKAFIADERGSEGIELGVTAVVVAGGAIAGFEGTRGAISSKQTEINNRLAATDISAE